jgi:hypothetical protein
MSAEETVPMHALTCDGGCGRRLGWCDNPRLRAVVMCTHCMDHPEEVEARLNSEASQ